MQCYEYKVIPAPTKGEKAKGVKTSADRFALTLTTLMNELGADGWSYVRADALPCEERAGLTGTKTTFVNVLVFSRPLPRKGALGTDEPVSLRVSPAAAPLVADPVPPAPVIPAPSVVAADVSGAPALGAARRDLAAE
ncbi:MAG: DUF4177 domain-containing protein [Paracoccaceae bacterium]